MNNIMVPNSSDLGKISTLQKERKMVQKIWKVNETFSVKTVSDISVSLGMF